MTGYLITMMMKVKVWYVLAANETVLDNFDKAQIFIARWLQSAVVRTYRVKAKGCCSTSLKTL